MNERCAGKRWLQVCGIIMLVISILMILSLVFSIFFTIIPLQNGTIDEFTKTALEAAGITEASLGTLKISTGISMTVYIIEAVVAVMGIAFCNKLGKAKFCMIAGIVAIVAVFAAHIYSAATGSFGIAGLMLVLILPVLFVFVANNNLKQSEGKYAGTSAAVQ